MEIASQKSPRIILIEAIALVCVGYAYFNIGDAGIKLLTKQLPFAEIIFIQALLITLMMGGYGLWSRGISAFRTKNPKAILLRALCIQVVTV
jgi:hypothetical protein